jgi:hypothetical protein
MIHAMFFLLAKDDGGPFACFLMLAFGVFAIVSIVSKLSASSTTNQFNKLQQAGTPALGIILKIDAIGTTIRGSSTYFSAQTASGGQTLVRNDMHQKNATVDVEIPGQAPYVVTGPLLMPNNMSGDILPGSSVELRVDPSNRSKLVIVGPGSGFAGFSQIPVTFQQDGSK